MDNLITQSCQDFSARLASGESVPGGGSAAALAGALGIALCAMAGNFTLGKQRYAAVEEDVRQILDEAETIRTRLLTLVDTDAQAFAPLSKAYGIPKEDPAREEILAAAARNACQAPREMAALCCRSIDLLEEMLEKGSRMLISDVGCGALLCRAALESAALNVFINTKAQKDRGEAGKIEREMENLLAEYVPKAQRIADETRLRIQYNP